MHLAREAEPECLVPAQFHRAAPDPLHGHGRDPLVCPGLRRQVQAGLGEHRVRLQPVRLQRTGHHPRDPGMRRGIQLVVFNAFINHVAK